MEHYHWWFPVTKVEGKPRQHSHKNGHRKHQHRSENLIFYGRTASIIRKQA